jgi:hypothetical protein
MRDLVRAWWQHEPNQDLESLPVINVTEVVGAAGAADRLRAFPTASGDVGASRLTRR